MSLYWATGSTFLELGFNTVDIGKRFHQHLVAIFEQAQQQKLLTGGDSNHLPVFFFSFLNGMLLTYGEDWQMVPEGEIWAAIMRMLGFKGYFS